RRKITGDQFQQSRFAGAVSADDADAFAAANDQRYVVQRRSLMIFWLAPEPQTRQSKDVERLLRRAFVEAVNLADTVQNDGWRDVRHSPRTRACLVGRGGNRARRRRPRGRALSVQCSRAAGWREQRGFGR